jgi:hypothetical protein
MSWDAVTIAWDNGQVARVHHGDMPKSGERRQSRSLCRYFVRALEHLERDVRSACETYTRQRQLAGLGACRVEQIGERAVGRCTIDDGGRRRAHVVANWLEAGQRIVAELSQMRIPSQFDLFKRALQSKKYYTIERMRR